MDDIPLSPNVQMEHIFINWWSTDQASRWAMSLS